MQNINLHIANSSGSLSDVEQVIQKAFDRAVQVCVKELKLSQVDVVCLPDSEMTIPEIGIGGYTPNRNLVFLYINPDKKDVSEDEIFYTLCHEFHHAMRYEGEGYGETLFESMVFEGLATCFESEISDNQCFMSKELAKTDGKKVLQQVKDSLGQTGFDHFKWFIFDAEGKLPRWCGYVVGYFIVEGYLKAENKKASEAILEASGGVQKFLRDTLEIDVVPS